MKIDDLITLRDEYKKNYIDAEKNEKLRLAYEAFSQNSIFYKIFCFLFRNSDYNELYKQFNYLNQTIEQWNDNFLAIKRNKLSDFFSLLDIKLNEQQKNIIISNEKTLLALAGAGSGKTLTIAAKVKYLVEVCKVKPEKILLLAFTRKSAGEMTERIVNKFGVNVKASTFHSLGYRIIYDVEGKKLRIPENSESIFYNFFENLATNNKKLIEQIKAFSKINEKISKDKIKSLSKLVYTFINLLRSRSGKISDIIRQNSDSGLLDERDKLFLNIAKNAQEYYENELRAKQLIDYNDMIIRSAEYIEHGKWKPKYEYVIIDEYQDISFSRYRLVNAIVKTSNSSLMCIGDDWQSIYRFTGSDVDLITNFKKYWGTFKKMKIEYNYRNTQENIDVSAAFVLKNPKQLSKKLVSSRHLKNPFKAIIYGSPSNMQASNATEAFIMALNDINQINGSKKINILLLGRNNADITMIFPENKNYLGIKYIKEEDDIFLKCDKYPNMNISFLTVHRAKGLEADYVIIVNMKSGITGFPNRIADDNVMRFVLSEPDDYEYAEERRLFYVAATRSKNITYLLVPDRHPSVFVKEIISN